MEAKDKTELLVQIYHDAVELGMEKKVAFKLITNAGYATSRRRLRQQLVLLKDTGRVSTRTQNTGRKRLLDDVLIYELERYLLDKNAKNEPFDHSDVQKWIHEELGVDMCLSTVGNYLKCLNFTRKTCQVKTSGFMFTKVELREIYMDFITGMENNEWFGYTGSCLRSMDATCTKRPTKRTHTHSQKGSGKQMSRKRIHMYTDAIVTMVSSDGKNRTPCVFYTHDPRMSLKQKNTFRGRNIRRALKHAMKKYGIREHRIVYVKSAKHFFGESAWMYMDFLTRNRVPKNVLILHDGGHAFKVKNESIFDALGYEKHCVYPSPVHQYLSPNDNNLHGVKEAWSRSYYRLKTSAEAALELMWRLDNDTLEHSRGYFERNLLQVDQESLAEIIKD